MKYGHIIKEKWILNEEITFLNNGSFGATPKKVLDSQQKFDIELEKEPLVFLLDKYPALLQNTIEKLATFLSVYKQDLFFIENATTGFNTIIRNLSYSFKKDDEILVTSNVYPSVKNTLEYFAKLIGIKITYAHLTFPSINAEDIINSVKKAINSKTKLAVFDHITSPTALIFPVKELTRICRNNGTLILIDGAHAPGMIDLNISEIAPDFYTGNCYKWMYAPKGSGFLWINPNIKQEIHPLVISLNYEQCRNKEFEWTGTRNPSSWLATSDAIDFYYEMGNENIRKYTHKLILDAANLLSDSLGFEVPIPNEMLGAMVTLPFKANLPPIQENTLFLRKHFLENYKIELPFMAFQNYWYFRISAQIFNEISDYIYLSECIKDFYKKRK